MIELKKVFASSLGKTPWILAVSGVGLCFAYAVNAPGDQVALVGLVPGIAMFLLARISDLVISPLSPTKMSENDKAIQELGAARIAVLTLVSFAILFGVIGFASSSIYWLLGFRYIAALVLKVAVITEGFAIAALLLDVISMVFGDTLSPGTLWRVVMCMVIFFIALPSSVTPHSASSPTQIKT